MSEELDAVGSEVPSAQQGAEWAEGRRVGVGARHRQHVFPGRAHVVKVRYGDQERAVVGRAAELTGLRPGGFVATAALLFARGLVDGTEADSPDAVVAEQQQLEMTSLGAHPVVVSWSAGSEREIVEELVQARLALRRYGVNVNQAVAALNSCGEAPAWLEQAVAGSDRAVARVDEATAALVRRFI